jgi:carboxymethylenebutenolidase
VSVLKGEGKVPILFGSTSIPAGSVTHGGYLARPDQAGSSPTIILLSAAWGVSSSTKDICRRLARQGFAVIAPDLYVGTAPPRSDSPEEAELDAASLPAERSAAIIEDVVAFTQNPAGHWSDAERGYGILTIGSGVRPGVRAAASAGVQGFAMVSPSFVAPVEEIPEDEAGEAIAEEVRVVVEPDDATDDLATVAAPILALSGGDDPNLTPEAIERCRGLAPHAEWIVYEGLTSDFVDDSAGGFDHPAFTDAIERLTAFFEKLLSPS